MLKRRCLLSDLIAGHSREAPASGRLGQYWLFKKVELMIAEEYETGNELELPTQL